MKVLGVIPFILNNIYIYHSAMHYNLRYLLRNICYLKSCNSDLTFMIKCYLLDQNLFENNLKEKKKRLIKNVAIAFF